MIIRSAAGMTFPIVVILVIAALAVSAILEIGLINTSYAQVTPGQNPMCDPSDMHINGTESRACGVPKTPSSLSSAVNSTTTTAGATIPTTTESPKPLSSPSPQSITPPSENATTQQGIIPGLLP